MPPDVPSKRFDPKLFFFTAACGFVTGTGASLFLHRVLHVAYGVLHILLVYTITAVSMALVYRVGLKIWPRSSGDTPR